MKYEAQSIDYDRENYREISFPDEIIEIGEEKSWELFLESIGD